MQNRDHLPRSRAQEVLVALEKSIHADPVRGLREKSLRFHFRIYRLAEYLVEGKPEKKRTQIVDIGHGAEAIDRSG